MGEPICASDAGQRPARMTSTFGNAMLQHIYSLLPFVAIGTLAAAGVALVLVLFVQEFRPAIFGGLIGALLLALICGASIGYAFGRSGMGADLGAMVGAFLVGLFGCSGFLIGIGVSACFSPHHRRFAAIPLTAGLLLPITWTAYATLSRTKPNQPTQPTQASGLRG